MSSSRRAINESDDEEQQSDDQVFERSAPVSSADADTRRCSASGDCEPPRRAPTDVASATRRSPTTRRASARRSRSSEDEEEREEDLGGTMRCDRHADRSAELYCQTCRVPICIACVSTRHRPMSGHECSDIDDAVVECRSRLAQHAAELADRHDHCLNVVEKTNAMIKSTRSQADEQESRVRRHFEEMRMRLEQDLQSIVQELEMTRNAKIKQLRTLSSEMQEIAVKLDGRRQQFDRLSVSGTDVEVVEGCASNTLTLRLDMPSASELPAYVQPQFTKSTVLQQTKNLVGELSSKNENIGPAQKPPDRDKIEANRRKSSSPSSWPCDNCTYINEDKDIECQICAYAPWKQKLLGLELLLGAGKAVPTERRSPSPTTWTCRACTTINQCSAAKCEACETPRDVSQRPPAYDSSWQTATHHRVPQLTVTEYFMPEPTTDCYRAPSPRVPSPRASSPRSTVDTGGAAAFMVNEGTQTDVQETGNFPQKMVNKLCQIVKNRTSPTPSSSSRDSSPSRSKSEPEMKWSADGRNTPWWVCSQCLYQNNMDRMECDQCGFEETAPSVTYFRH